MIPTKPSDQQQWKVSLVMAPVLMVGHFFGISFYYWRNRRLWRYLYKGFVFLIMLASLIHEFPSIMFWAKYSSGLHGLLVKLEAFSWWFSYYANFFLTSFKSGKINSAIDRLQNCNVPLSRTVQNKLFKFHLFYLILNMGMIVVYNGLGHNLVWPNANYTLFTSIIYIFGDFMILASFYEFVHLINLIGEIFKEINRNFKGYRKREESRWKSSNLFGFHSGEIVRIRENHLFLTKTCADVNSCFSEQLLLIICCSMIQCLYAVRSILGDFSITEIEESILNIVCDTLWLLPYLTTIFQLIVFCEKTTKEARRTLTIVHHLMNVYYYDRETLRELELFAFQVQQHPILFNVRFFELQYPFLNTLVSSLTTYFVILATFQGESDNGNLVNWNFDVKTTAATQDMIAEALT